MKRSLLKFDSLCLLALMIVLYPVRHSSATVSHPKIEPENANQVAELNRLGKGQVARAIWSPDGRLLAVGGVAGIWLYDAQRLDSEPRYLPGQFPGLFDQGTQLTIFTAFFPLLFSPVSGIAAFPNDPTTFYRWGIGSNTFPGMMIPTGLVSREAAFTNDRILMFSGNSIYSVQSQRHIANVDMPRGFARIAISPNDQLFATSEEYSNYVHLWNAHTLAVEAEWRINTNSAEIAFSPDGRLVAIGGADQLSLIDVATKAIIADRTSESAITCLAFSPDGTMIAAGTDSGIIQIWGVSPQ